MTITKDDTKKPSTKKAKAAGTEPVGEKVVPAQPWHPYGYNGHQKANSNISISSNSALGQAHLTNIVTKALAAEGFTNVTLHNHSDFGMPPGEVDNRPKIPAEADSVLSALTERNPSFFRAPISISSNRYHYQDIVPDSEYPCAGAPVSKYETGGYGGQSVIAVDQEGGKEHFASFTTMTDAERISSLLNKDLGA